MADEEKIILSIEAEDNATSKLKNITKTLKDVEKESENSTNGMASRFKNMANSMKDVAPKIEDGIRRINNVTRHYNVSMSGLNRSIIRNVKEMGSAMYDFTSGAIDNFTQLSEQHAKTLGAMAADYDKTAESQARFFEDAQKLKEQALQIGMYGVNGNGSLMDATGVSEVQTELIKAGVPASTIADPNSNVTRDILEFAQGNDIDTSSAVEFAVTLGSQFGVKQEDWGSMLDKVSHTADMSVIDVKDIVQSMKYAGGITSGLDRSLEETLGMISIMGNFGLKGTQSGSGIQALLTRLLTGDTTVITDAQAKVAPPKALEKFYEFEKKAKPNGKLLPMSDVIDELDKTMSDMNDEEQAWFAKKLFGLYQMKSAYALMNGDETDLNEVIKEISEQSEGTNENKLNLLLDSQYGQLTSLTNLWEGMKTDIGDKLSPFVDSIRDELFNYLKNNGNYNINFDNLRSTLEESATLIEDQYGTAIANAVRNLGNIAIDFTSVSVEIAPALGEGIMEMLSSLFRGDFFGSDGVFANWSNMIDEMEVSVGNLPEDLQDLGQAVVSTIDWFGKLTTLNIASEIAELVSSVLQILTIAGGAFIKVAGAVVVQGNSVSGGGGKGGTGGGAGTGGASTAGSAGARGARGALNGSTTIGSADDVARTLGTTADDVVATFGKQASYSIDDIARGFGTTADDVISGYGSAIDDVVQNSGKIFKGFSKFGKSLGIIGTLWQLWSSGSEAYGDYKSGDYRGTAEAIGGGGGSLGGGALGGTIGTAIAPGVGTVIGAIIGSVGGDWLGRKGGGMAYDSITYEDIPIKYTDMSDEQIKTWQSTQLAQENYRTALTTSTDAQELLNKKLESYMMLVKDGDPGYNKSLDKTGNGYNVWTGTKDGLTEYLNRLGYSNNTGDPLQFSNKGTSISNPYMLNDLTSSIKNAIIDGMNQSNSSKSNGGKSADKDNVVINSNNTNLTGDVKLPTSKTSRDYLANTNPSTSSKNVTLNAGSITFGGELSIPEITLPKVSNTTADNVTLNAQSTNLTGNVSIPNIDALVREINGGFQPLSQKGKEDLIQNTINNQIQIDDTVNMQPKFDVAAPNVNVNVRVDKEDRVIKQVSVLNPQQNVILNNWFSRTSAQYGRTSK